MTSHKYSKFILNNIPAKGFTMTPLELNEYIDFDVKRVYFISSPEGNIPTGSHSHYKESELFIMVAGSCTIVVDDGSGLEEIQMTGPQVAVSIPPMVWHHFKNISPDAVICALTSTNYSSDRSDYCEDYTQFQKLTSA